MLFTHPIHISNLLEQCFRFMGLTHDIDPSRLASESELEFPTKLSPSTGRPLTGDSVNKSIRSSFFFKLREMVRLEQQVVSSERERLITGEIDAPSLFLSVGGQLTADMDADF